MMRFFLVRHGQTTANVSGVMYGSTDLPLTPEGIEQGRRIAGYLEPVSFNQTIASQLQRAQHTARLIVPSCEAPHIDQRLNEMDFGAWEMRHFSAIVKDDPHAWQRWMDDWQNASPTDGEPFPRFAARVNDAAEELSKQRGNADKLIVAHQGVLSLLLAHWLSMPVEAMWRFPFMHDAYTVVENREGYMSLRVFNDRSIFRPEQ